MFELCCNCPSIINYDIKHNPKPISLNKTMDKTIKELIWYVPCISSFQAEEDELIKDKLYDNFTFTYIMEKMGMVEDRDVKWVSQPGIITDSDWAFYENSICCSCQKIIIRRNNSLSKTNDLLRCIRNCIAHGHFSIVDEYLIGFNRKDAKDPLSQKTAIIKLKPKLLFSVLNTLSTFNTKELLVGYAFERIGYKVLKEKLIQNYRVDLLIKKNNKKYAIEIKEYSGIQYLHVEHLNAFLHYTSQHIPGVVRILLIDTSRVTKEVRELEKRLDDFKIIDKSQVKLMLGENPTDILA